MSAPRITQAGDFGRVGVLMGGWSAERQVSLWSGQAVLTALRAVGVDAHGVDVTRARLLSLRDDGFDRVFIALHGSGGEDGVVQGLLEVMQLPYTGSGVLGSAVAMDKVRSKLVWSAAGIATPPHALLDEDFDRERVVAELGLPLFVKPAAEGSTFGGSKVVTADQLPAAYRAARQYGRSVLAETFIDGPEYTASMVAGEALPLIRIEAPDGLYDFQAKYQSDRTRYRCPCDLPAERERALRTTAMQAMRLLAGRGWGRVDLLLDGNHEPWFLELNTVPGMTSHSLVPQAARAFGWSFEELVWRILETSMHPSGDPGVTP